ncbi:sulfatase-like hydrolase/transferase [Pelagicoccus mobilis]|uniref:Sulfatase n=1 Tax=Pelagicoccus mobilis TaxID=415221 RepID=A0A934VJC9_9BACT|nr:sulfatase [Pelagicoccus mobilis]MBK1875481.1 sulfatase [Pelagicoccus mobilis]
MIPRTVSNSLIQRAVLRLSVLSLFSAIAIAFLGAAEKPNILWLTIEDTSAYEFGCYGNEDVETPNIDALAAGGLQMMKAWSSAPHCSPARSTLITGSYATTYGMDNHRRRWDTPAGIFYPELLREAGYYCTNNSKTDYNTTRNRKGIWDECSSSATYNSSDRRPGQPFFAVFNANITHMSRLTSVTTEGRRGFGKEGLDPQSLDLPTYVPDLPEVRSDYAFHLEGVQDVDRWVGLFLKDLEERSLSEDTIVFFYSDHGGSLPRGKGFLYESGLRVPFLIYVPEKFRHLVDFNPGTQSDRLIGFVDVAPTLLSLLGIEPPQWMQGQAFLGEFEQPAREMQFAFRTNQERHYDPCRAATDGRWKYIRSYLPSRAYCLRNDFQWQMPSNLAWDAYAAERSEIPERSRADAVWLQPFTAKGVEMLFDLEADPHEEKNLAGDPAYETILAKMRKAVSRHVRETRDLGFFPPTSKVKQEGVSLYDWVNQNRYDLEALISLAEKASLPERSDLAEFLAAMESEYPEIRFWAAAGISELAARGELKEVPRELGKALYDSDAYVSATVAEALCLAGQSSIGLPVLIEGVRSNSGEKMAPFYSALETLSRNPKQVDSLRAFKEEIAALGGFSARSLLVNIGAKEVEELYPLSAKKKGRQVNETRRPLKPLP